jgi:hypothetical protein
MPVELGGEVDRKLSDGYLVTSMIHPSCAFAPLPREKITAGGISRMPAYADKMTVRQMIDIVAFLQSSYTIRQRAPSYAYRYLSAFPPDPVPRYHAALR